MGIEPRGSHATQPPIKVGQVWCDPYIPIIYLVVEEREGGAYLCLILADADTDADRGWTTDWTGTIQTFLSDTIWDDWLLYEC